MRLRILFVNTTNQTFQKLIFRSIYRHGNLKSMKDNFSRVIYSSVTRSFSKEELSKFMSKNWGWGGGGVEVL